MKIASHDEAQLLIRYLIADKFIDVDLSSYIPEQGILDVKSIADMRRGRSECNFLETVFGS